MAQRHPGQVQQQRDDDAGALKAAEIRAALLLSSRAQGQERPWILFDQELRRVGDGVQRADEHTTELQQADGPG